jgi:hypothetical protein
MEEWVKERDAYLEEFITTLGLDRQSASRKRKAAARP